LEQNPNDKRALHYIKVLLNQLEEGDLEHKINEYLTVKLINNRTYVYLNNEYFSQCMNLFISIKNSEREHYDTIDSIDEAAEIYQSILRTGNLFKLEGEQHYTEPIYLEKVKILPQEEFWGHCSNLQCWVENNYNTRLLHTNIAFPLLKALSNAGDPNARRVFKEEIAQRFNNGFKPGVLYLIKEGYLDFLDEEEQRTLFESLGINNLLETLKSESEEAIVELKVRLQKLAEHTE